MLTLRNGWRAANCGCPSHRPVGGRVEGGGQLVRVAVAPAVDPPVVDVALGVEVAALLVDRAVDDVDHGVLEVLPAHLAQHLLPGRVGEQLRDRVGVVRDDLERQLRRALRRLVGRRPVVAPRRGVGPEARPGGDAERVPEQRRPARRDVRHLRVGEGLPVVQARAAVDQRHLARVAERLHLARRQALHDVRGDAVPARHDHVLGADADALAAALVLVDPVDVVDHVVDRRVSAAVRRPRRCRRCC